MFRTLRRSLGTLGIKQRDEGTRRWEELGGLSSTTEGGPQSLDESSHAKVMICDAVLYSNMSLAVENLYGFLL